MIHPVSSSIEATSRYAQQCRSSHFQQKRLGPLVVDYIIALSFQNPFVQNIKIDQRDILKILPYRWPNMSEWNEQAELVWNRINDIVHTVPTSNPLSKVYLHISAASDPLSPVALPAPDAPTIIATFDTVHGVYNQCTFSPYEDAQALDVMTIPAGLMVICQPLPTHFYIQSEEELKGYDPTRLYTLRGRDKVLTHMTPRDKIPRIRNIRATNQPRLPLTGHMSPLTNEIVPTVS